ncbi:SCO6745 family protein [Pseudonocardia sp. CA-107938]|uniref:SCO6745 family protein n=1 Tax=Pseudonocardia sp. CA-107938 TaxID=3240021 RepID=UPI003D8FA12F
MQATVPAPLVRGLWQVLEPVHAVLYYAPEVTAEAAALGYATGTRWPSYFPLRSAPLGRPGATVVAAAFYSFAPEFVAEHMDAAWTTAEPSDVLAARERGVAAALHALLPDAPGIVEAAGIARRAAEAAVTAGRPLAAGNAALPFPDDPLLQLWHAATILREHRGDGHVTALLDAGLDPVESLVSFAAIGAAPRATFASRAWTDEAWDAAVDRLRSRGLLDADGTATDAGRALRDRVEERTDALAAQPWAAIGVPEAAKLAQLVGPLTARIAGSGLLPAVSTLGIRRPT